LVCLVGKKKILAETCTSSVPKGMARLGGCKA